jgi:hypothetical protein
MPNIPRSPHEDVPDSHEGANVHDERNTLRQKIFTIVQGDSERVIETRKLLQQYYDDLCLLGTGRAAIGQRLFRYEVSRDVSVGTVRNADGDIDDFVTIHTTEDMVAIALRNDGSPMIFPWNRSDPVLAKYVDGVVDENGVPVQNAFPYSDVREMWQCRQAFSDRYPFDRQQEIGGISREAVYSRVSAVIQEKTRWGLPAPGFLTEADKQIFNDLIDENSKKRQKRAVNRFFALCNSWRAFLTTVGNKNANMLCRVQEAYWDWDRLIPQTKNQARELLEVLEGIDTQRTFVLEPRSWKVCLFMASIMIDVGIKGASTGFVNSTVRASSPEAPPPSASSTYMFKPIDEMTEEDLYGELEKNEQEIQRIHREHPMIDLLVREWKDLERRIDAQRQEIEQLREQKRRGGLPKGSTLIGQATDRLNELEQDLYRNGKSRAPLGQQILDCSQLIARNAAIEAKLNS